MATTVPPADPENRTLRILVADEEKEVLERLARTLRGLGHEVTDFALEPGEAAEAIGREDPDLSLVKVHDDVAHALGLIAEAASMSSGPVIAVLENDDPDVVARAAGLGIHAYTEGEPSSVASAIEVAMRRHAEVEALEGQVRALTGALERRAQIERAKGILMEREGLDERGAFELLRGRARSTSRRIVDVAKAVEDGAEQV